MSESSAPPPDADMLHQAALAYLARYAATRAGLKRVLQRRIDRWGRAQPDADPAIIAAAQAALEAVVERMVLVGAVNDEAFAQNRAQSLTRAGKSARSVQARLVAKGVAPAMARDAATTDAATELAAALVLSRRRRIGPFRTCGDGDAAVLAKELGVLARAGFNRDVAERTLSLDREEAERRIHALRR